METSNLEPILVRTSKETKIINKKRESLVPHPTCVNLFTTRKHVCVQLTGSKVNL